MQNKSYVRCALTGALLSCLFFCLSQPLAAQKRYSDISVIDNDDLDAGSDDYCRPGLPFKSRGKGVELRYELQGSHTLGFKDSEGSDSEVEQYAHFVAKFKIPIINAPSVKFMLGYEYVKDQFEFESIGTARSNLMTAMDGRKLKTNKFSAYFTKGWNERFYTVARARVETRGDYTGFADFSKPFVTYSGALIFGKKPDKVTEWGVGLTFSQNELRTQVLPFAVYNKNFNDKWGLETVLPVHIFGRYNVNPGCIALFGTRYESKANYMSWTDGKGGSINNDLMPAFLRQGNVRVEAMMEKQIHGWIWAYASTGVIIPIINDFRSIQDDVPDIDLQGGIRPMLRVGVFLSPPDSMIK